MTLLMFSADLTTDPTSLGLSLRDQINSLDDFIKLIHSTKEILTEMILDSKGQFRRFLVIVVDDEVVSNENLVNCLLNPKEIVVFNAVANS